MGYFKDNAMKYDKQIEFAKLRHAYITVKSFLEKEAGENVGSLKTRIAEDLSLWGDDNYEMLIKFIEQFEIDYSEFEYDKHFHSEGEVADPINILLNLLSLSVWLPLKTIELLTFGSVKIKNPSFHQPEREVSDMTFKDLLTSYIEGKFTKSENIKYVL
jgi:hypothetical protein